jgi:hypothetical protein
MHKNHKWKPKKMTNPLTKQELEEIAQEIALEQTQMIVVLLQSCQAMQ